MERKGRIEVEEDEKVLNFSRGRERERDVYLEGRTW